MTDNQFSIPTLGHYPGQIMVRVVGESYQFGIAEDERNGTPWWTVIPKSLFFELLRFAEDYHLANPPPPPPETELARIQRLIQAIRNSTGKFDVAEFTGKVTVSASEPDERLSVLPGEGAQ